MFMSCHVCSFYSPLLNLSSNYRQEQPVSFLNHFLSRSCWHRKEAAAEAAFLNCTSLKLPNRPPISSVSWSLTFGRTCLRQVGRDLQWLPHKSDDPVYWRLPLVSLSAWPVCFIRWLVLTALIYWTVMLKLFLHHFVLDFCSLFRVHV